MFSLQSSSPFTPDSTRARKLAQRVSAAALVALGLALGAAASARAAIGSHGSADTSVFLYVDGSPLQKQEQLDAWGSMYNPAPPGAVYSVNTESRVGGDAARAFASGDLGVLKASAAANFSERYQPGITGYALARASANFSDEWLVQGNGLTDGTPISLLFTLRIHGEDSSALILYGTSQRAGAAVSLTASDGRPGGASTFYWVSGSQQTGDHVWGYDTFVGSTVRLSASLSAGASVDQYSTVGSMYADYSHTFNLYATPSLAGVGTLSLGGHDYALPAVPEPATWLLMAFGGLALAFARRARPSAGH